MLTQQNAPAFGRGVSDQIGTPIAFTPTEKRHQTQLLSQRFGLSGPLASVILALLREEPWHDR